MTKQVGVATGAFVVILGHRLLRLSDTARLRGRVRPRINRCSNIGATQPCSAVGRNNNGSAERGSTAPSDYDRTTQHTTGPLASCPRSYRTSGRHALSHQNDDMMLHMRTTLNLAEDAFHVARHLADRENLSLGDAVSILVRAGAQARAAAPPEAVPLRGRFALLPARDEVITVEHVRELMEREGI